MRPSNERMPSSSARGETRVSEKKLMESGAFQEDTLTALRDVGSCRGGPPTVRGSRAKGESNEQ